MFGRVNSNLIFSFLFSLYLIHVYYQEIATHVNNKEKGNRWVVFHISLFTSFVLVIAYRVVLLGGQI